MSAPRWSAFLPVLALSAAQLVFSQTNPGAPCVPVNPDATPEARALLEMLCAISGNAILSGQHNYPNHLSQHSDATAAAVGKYPTVWGSDFGFAAEGKDAITGRDAMIAEAERQYKAGSIITLMWHVVRPVDNEPNGWKESVQNKLTDFEWSELITPGTNLNKRWMAQIDTIAPYLKRLQEAKIPVLWRPYHEANGDWFWWGGRPGEHGFQALYRMTYDRMVNYHHLNNLIWAWNVNAPNGKNAGPYADYYPGADVVDVLSSDIYSDFLPSHYDNLLALAKGKPIALGEIGRVPAVEILRAQPKWTWFMIWADFLQASKPEDAKALFNDPRTRNRGDELPWPIPVNYDEAKVGAYTLPDPLTLASGKPVRTAAAWYKQRRPEILRLFEENMQGRAPARPKALRFDVFDKGTPAFDGKALRRQVTVLFTGQKTGPQMDLALYLPAGAKGKVPVLLCINFEPNSTTINDPGLKRGEMWERSGQRVPAPAAGPHGTLDVERILSHGFGVASVYYGDIEPDFNGGMKLGVRGAFLKPGQDKPAADEWGAIGAWAWGLSRALDYLETDKGVDAKRVGLLGLSRLGKTVLWAGATDPRFALVIESCSGEGGASLSRRNYGETVKHLNRVFPYWFSENYLKFGDHAGQLPVDANMLLALIAPRPLLVQSGDQDRWADPKGEFLAAVAAGPIYRLLGKQDLGTDQWPAAGEPVLHTIGYTMHSGGHGILPADWDVYLRFLDMHFKK